MFIIKNNEEYYLDIFSGTKELLLKKLSLYKINLKVKIEDISDKYIAAYSRTKSPGDIIIYKDPRSEKLGYRAILALHWISDQVRDDNTDEYLEDKYEYSIPDGGVDLLYDKAMPQEYMAEEMNAISYTKGCYVGQEVISRTKYQGQVRKTIYKVTADTNLEQILHGAEITSDGKKIGIFLSGYHDKAMALIRSEDLAASSGKILLGDREIRCTRVL